MWWSTKYGSFFGYFYLFLFLLGCCRLVFRRGGSSSLQNGFFSSFFPLTPPPQIHPGLFFLVFFPITSCLFFLFSLYLVAARRDSGMGGWMVDRAARG